tara:strand:+ start:160 stop:1389 length:1230 start_codon:yes stop_codon:yes gene_type:complete
MINIKEKKYLDNLINKYQKKENSQIRYPLLDNALDNDDIIQGIEVILSQKITMSEITQNFEKEFAKYIGSKYALMVNSGSSANLLSAFALVNYKKKNRLKPGDKFLIPAICWSTSLWPFIQCGLKPQFVDVNKNNFCLDERKIDIKNTKLIVLIHILGNSSNMEYITKFSKENDILLFEDTCEALGSKYKSKYLGTLGEFGTYSFYYSHQITSGEGGMIVCNDKENYEIIHSMRSHGWDRGLKSNKTNKNFNFINSGFNLRPLDITAAIGLNQFKKLNKMMETRRLNRNKIIHSLKSSNLWNNQFSFFEPNKNVKPSWFGLPLIINDKLVAKKTEFLKFLNRKGIETRPILSGNFLNQPSAKLYNLQKDSHKFFNANYIEKNGFFIGLPTKKINPTVVNFLVKNLLSLN